MYVAIPLVQASAWRLRYDLLQAHTVTVLARARLGTLWRSSLRLLARAVLLLAYAGRRCESVLRIVSQSLGQGLLKWCSRGSPIRMHLWTQSSVEGQKRS